MQRTYGPSFIFLMIYVLFHMVHIHLILPTYFALSVALHPFQLKSFSMGVLVTNFLILSENVYSMFSFKGHFHWTLDSRLAVTSCVLKIPMMHIFLSSCYFQTCQEYFI